MATRTPLRFTLLFLGLVPSIAGAKLTPLASQAARCSSLLYDPAEWIREVKKDPRLLAHAEKIKSFVTTYLRDGSVDRQAAKIEVFTLLADLRDAGKLKRVLAKVVSEARHHPSFPPISGDDAAVADQLFNMLDAELYSNGFSPLGAKAAFKPWAALAKEQLATVRGSGMSLISSKEFSTEFQKLVGAVFRRGTRARLVSDAKEALSERIRMITNAKESIWIASWAFYGGDDNAGKIFADLLIKRHQEGIDVRVMVDGLVGERIGYRENLQRMRDAGIPVVLYRSEKNPYYGHHRKFMIVDHPTGAGEAIAGGRNIGDDYLHTGTKPTSPKWRDTDMIYQGEPVRDNARLFLQDWNDQCDRLARANPADAEKHRKLKIAEEKIQRRQRTYQRDGVTMAILDHTPNAEDHDPIYLGLIKAIDAAQHSIDIANAYVILTPGMKEAILRARARGVRVRIFTNSARSVDEPIVSVPILRSLAELLAPGCEIYVKNGDTLHSKVAVFDGELTWVMSYNLHPRSLRYEKESANVVLGRGFAATATEAYEADLSIAKKINTVADLEIPDSKISNIGFEFFDQL